MGFVYYNCKNRRLLNNYRKEECQNVISKSDPAADAGDFKISGDVKAWIDEVNSPNNVNDNIRDNPNIRKFIIRTSQSNDSAVFMIDQNGNLYMKGGLFENVF